MDKPSPPPVIQAPDPRIAQQQAAADAANMRALSGQAEIDTASLMARYGARLAMAGAALPAAAPVLPTSFKDRGENVRFGS